MVLDIRQGRALSVRKLTDDEATALDAMYRAVLMCDAVEAWASGAEADEQPYWFVQQALFVALEDLFGPDHAKELMGEIHSSGENPSRVVEQYFGVITRSE